MSTNHLCAHQLTRLSHPYLIERLRVIYNGALADLSTHPIPEHTPTSQLKWWEELDHDAVTVHLYSFRSRPWNIMGFSMITDRGRYASVMHAVAEESRGFGFGGEIMDHTYAVAFGTPLVASSLASNKAICRWNSKKGWNLYAEHAGVQYLWLPNGSDLTESEYVEIMIDYMSRHGT